MIPFKGHQGGLYLLSICVTIQCLLIRLSLQNVQNQVKKTLRERRFPDEDYQLYWDEKPEPGYQRSNSTFLPTGVFDFQTGRVPLFDLDLNHSSTNQFSVTDNPRRRITEQDWKIRPNKYGRTRHNKKGKTQKIKGRFGDKINVESTSRALHTEGNENVEIHKKTVKETAAGGGADGADNAPAANEHKNERENKKHMKGSGEEHHEDHHDKKKTKGEKAHKKEHHYHKGEKGHHDKEGHKGQYSDKKGTKKGHKEGGGHFEAGAHEEKGKKETKHSDKEEYKKGHSTRGGRVVHKKDEYEKKHEFYDEHHEGGEDGRNGEYFEEHHAEEGGHEKSGHKHGKASGHHKGKKGHYEKGNKFHEQKGHKKKGRHDKKHEHSEKYGKKKEESHRKKFEYDRSKGKLGDSRGSHSHGRAALVRAPAGDVAPGRSEEGSDADAERKHRRGNSSGKRDGEDTTEVEGPGTAAGTAATRLAADRFEFPSEEKPVAAGAGVFGAFTPFFAF